MFYLHTSFKTTTEFLSLFESFSVMCIHILYNTCIDVIHVFLYYIFLLGGGVVLFVRPMDIVWRNF